MDNTPTYDINRRKQYLQIDAEDEERLRGLQPLARKHLKAVVDRFYEHLLAHEETK